VTPAEIRDVAANAGFAGADLATAVAIALPESGGDPSAYNPESQKGTPPGQGSYGLWQIYLWKHPEFAGINLMDPQENAHAAYQLYSQHGFTPWATYNSGKYRAFLTAAQLPGTAPSGAPYMVNFDQPLTIDAATGLPVDTASITPSLVPDSPSFGTVILWVALGIGVLWVFSEAS
jgi:hypothetical protein